jgi:sn-glycerol 3-phosphate transport system substrate-binding protein
VARTARSSKRSPKKFNDSQTEYHVTPVFKGTYPETLTAAIAAFRAGQQPAIVQVFEVGTGTMMAAKGAVYPVYKLMKDEGEAWDPSKFLAPVVGYYSDPEGNILSMPFNSSTPILYYNKDVFKKAGLDPEVAPKTWAELATMGKKIVDSGAAKCGFTMSYGATWVGLENYSAIQNLPYGTKQNGFGGMDAEFTFNGPNQVKFWDNLKKWQDEGVYKYGGPSAGADAAPMFYAQQCAVYMNSSASRSGVINNAKDFKVGFAPMPYDDTVTQGPEELHHRRCDAVGAERPEGQGSLQGCCQVLHLPLDSRKSRLTGTSSPATCRSPTPPTSLGRAGLLRQEPGFRHRHQADHARHADRQLQGRSLRQPDADP